MADLGQKKFRWFPVTLILQIGQVLQQMRRRCFHSGPNSDDAYVEALNPFQLTRTILSKPDE